VSLLLIIFVNKKVYDCQCVYIIYVWTQAVCVCACACYRRSGNVLDLQCTLDALVYNVTGVLKEASRGFSRYLKAKDRITLT
jgi:hypothetical protein